MPRSRSRHGYSILCQHGATATVAIVRKGDVRDFVELMDRLDRAGVRFVDSVAFDDEFSDVAHRATQMLYDCYCDDPNLATC